MSDLGFGAGGVSEALQLYQALQTGQISNEQKKVELESSKLQLDNMKKLQATLGGQAFQQAFSGGSGGEQHKALTELAGVYLSNNMPQQAKSVMDMATSAATTQAYVTEQQALAAKKYVDMAEDLFSGVSSPAEWRQAQMFMQSQMPPEAMSNPTVKALLTAEYSPEKVKILPGFLDKLRTKAQTAADQARATAEDARMKAYRFEEDRDEAQAAEARARAEYLERQGGGGLVPTKPEIEAAANDLQAMYPEPEAEPVVQGGKITDSTAIRSNYKARVQARATEVAEAAKAYTKEGMKPDAARKRAIQEAEARGDLSTLKPIGPQSKGASASTPAGNSIPAKPGSAASADTWGEPTVSP